MMAIYLEGLSVMYGVLDWDLQKGSFVWDRRMKGIPILDSQTYGCGGSMWSKVGQFDLYSNTCDLKKIGNVGQKVCQVDCTEILVVVLLLRKCDTRDLEN